MTSSMSDNEQIKTNHERTHPEVSLNHTYIYILRNVKNNKQKNTKTGNISLINYYVLFYVSPNALVDYSAMLRKDSNF